MWHHWYGRDTPDCAAQIIATVGGISRQVLGSPALVRSAFTDPIEELRKARERNEKFATAEISVAGEALCSGYAAFNGEVIRTGPSLERALPVVALGGAEVQRDGKTLTVQPKQTPTLLLQLPNEKEAENWHEWLKEATQRDDPVQRLHDVLTEAHDLEKHLTDMQNQMKRGHGHGHHGHQEAGGQFGHHDPVSPTSPESHGISGELIEEMKQQLLLKESLESAWRQKLEYMDLQLRQKEQENQYFKAQLYAVREEMKAAKEIPQAGDAGSLVELKRMEEALSQERANAVAQAKALAEAHVQLKRMQDRPQDGTIVRAQQDELMQLRGELRRIEEERNTARLGLANQALQLSALSDQQMELQSALNAAQGEIKRQKEQLEEMRLQNANASHGATPRAGEKQSGSEKNTTSKLSHSELQVLRTHMQSAVRRALEGAAAEQGLEYQQKLQELDEKLVELSPTRLRARQSGSGSRSGAVVREVEQKLAQLSPQGSPPGAKVANGGSLNFTGAFGMEDSSTLPNEVVPMRVSPLRRPSNMSSSEVILPQGLNSDGRVVAATNLSATHPGPPGSITLPSKLPADRPFATAPSWAPGRSLQAPAPGVMRAMEVMPAAQMAANAVAATSGWQPYGLHGAPAFQTLPREHGYTRG